MYISIEKNSKKYSTLPDEWDETGKEKIEFEKIRDKITIRQSQTTHQIGKYVYYKRIAEIELTGSEAEILYSALKIFTNKLNGIETINPDLITDVNDLKIILDRLKSKTEGIKNHLQQILDLAKII